MFKRKDPIDRFFKQLEKEVEKARKRNNSSEKTNFMCYADWLKKVLKE